MASSNENSSSSDSSKNEDPHFSPHIQKIVGDKKQRGTTSFTSSSSPEISDDENTRQGDPIKRKTPSASPSRLSAFIDMFRSAKKEDEKSKHKSAKVLFPEKSNEEGYVKGILASLVTVVAMPTLSTQSKVELSQVLLENARKSGVGNGHQVVVMQK